MRDIVLEHFKKIKEGGGEVAFLDLCGGARFDHDTVDRNFGFALSRRRHWKRDTKKDKLITGNIFVERDFKKMIDRIVFSTEGTGVNFVALESVGGLSEYSPSSLYFSSKMETNLSKRILARFCFRRLKEISGIIEKEGYLLIGRIFFTGYGRSRIGVASKARKEDVISDHNVIRFLKYFGFEYVMTDETTLPGTKRYLFKKI